ncbi:putative secreted protein [Corynebacterium renale]|uniref:Alpha helical porin B n=1 Tax=Corynebacterium renale TaxID=1724 RepID=A0A2A9DRN0_9CORY|nr:hypothetical protein [Corynebacterium renale]PFG29041.1 alpha helical porin B [Corynebacterium renale]SQG64365.1 putative secreted protein [Corynebacterium renale]SQI25291.1 putative secreted protein [Corynebacterium renale]STC95061.1 putative secreted protein [Corynebacterium renale]
MRIRTRIAATAAAILTTAGITAPAAQANPLELFGAADQLIAAAPCNTLGDILRGTGVLGADTTRGQLVESINKGVNSQNNDPLVSLLTGKYSNQIANKAQQCGLVKADPVHPLLAGSSQLPEPVKQTLTQLTALSSR